jgi:hypothetical protein
VLAVLAAVGLAAELAAHAALVLVVLAVVLVVLAVVATAVVLVLRHLARSRVCMVSRPGLPSASRPAAIAAPAAPGRGRLPAPAQVKAIGPPPRQVVAAEIVREVRREASRPL